MTTRQVAVALGVMGLLPFVGSSFLVGLGSSFRGVDPAWIFISYSAVILSFLSGTLWGKCLNVVLPVQLRPVLILSNVFALVAWCGLLLWSSPRIALAALAAGYIAVLWVERRYDGQQTTKPDPGYTKMRRVLTAVVVVAHLLVFVGLAGSGIDR